MKKARINKRYQLIVASLTLFQLEHLTVRNKVSAVSQESVYDDTIQNSKQAKNFANQLKQSAADALHKVIQEQQEQQIMEEDFKTMEMEDEDTLLDTFGHSAKKFLTQRFIPKTDSECDWSWRTGRCEPFCYCQLQYQWGDYHLGRSCRLVDRDYYETSYDSEDEEEDENMCADEDPTVYALAIDKIIHLQREAHDQLHTKIKNLQEQWGQFHQEFCYEEEEKVEEETNEEPLQDQEKINLLLFPPDKFPNIVDSHQHPTPTKTSQPNPFKKQLQKVVCQNNSLQDQYDLDKGRKKFIQFVNEQQPNTSDVKPSPTLQGDNDSSNTIISEK